VVARRSSGLPAGWKLELMMRDVACRERFLSHTMSTCAGGFQAWLWAGGMGKEQTCGAPTTTA